MEGNFIMLTAAGIVADHHKNFFDNPHGVYEEQVYDWYPSGRILCDRPPSKAPVIAKTGPNQGFEAFLRVIL